MGWFMGDDFVDDGYHEGHVVGLIEDGRDRWRELKSGGPQERTPTVPIRRFQVACECGWRSRRFVAPALAEWVPSYVELHNDTIDDAAGRIWRRHVEAERAEQCAAVNRVPTPAP